MGHRRGSDGDGTETRAGRMDGTRHPPIDSHGLSVSSLSCRSGTPDHTVTIL